MTASKYRYWLSVPSLALAIWATVQADMLASTMQDVSTAWSDGRFAEAIAAFDELPAVEQTKPSALFIAGASYFRRHDFKRAKPLLQQAGSGNLVPRQAQSAQAMLAHIHTLEQLCPPFQRSYSEGSYTINFYAAKNAWSDHLAAQMPQFLQHAVAAFGNEAAAVNFYLFDQRAAYDEFFNAWRIGEPLPEKHRGTGGMQIVEFCKFYPNGTVVGANNINDLYSRVLHEYSHALCHTVYGDRYGFDCPQWLNEGMADYFGWQYRPELYDLQAELLRKAALTGAAPTYEQMSHGFYRVENGYLIANVLVEELLRGQNMRCFRKIIDTAKSNGGNFEAAVQEVTGKEPRAVYASIVRRYWG
ncbi:MAG TPA: hypothetical protein V6D22_09100 [Candidatus Obscuribacterales bacterium]